MKLAKVILALLLFGCLFKVPYGYFQVTRVFATVVFAIMAYECSNNKDKRIFILCVGLALLFKPLVKIPLGRVIWNMVDVAVGVALLISVAVPLHKRPKQP